MWRLSLKHNTPGIGSNYDGEVRTVVLVSAHTSIAWTTNKGGSSDIKIQRRKSRRSYRASSCSDDFWYEKMFLDMSFILWLFMARVVMEDEE